MKKYLDGSNSIVELSSKYKISTSMVLNWLKKYNEGKRLEDYNPIPEVYTMKSTKKTIEEKIEITKYVLNNNNDYKGAASKFNVNYSSVYAWVKKYKELGKEGLKTQKRGPQKRTINLVDMTELEKYKYLYEEEKRKKELAEFKVEVLKKKRK